MQTDDYTRGILTGKRQKRGEGDWPRPRDLMARPCSSLSGWAPGCRARDTEMRASSDKLALTCG